VTSRHYDRRPEQVSGAGQKPVERSGERVWKNLPERERIVERERRGERAKLAAHIPLQCNSSKIS